MNLLRIPYTLLMVAIVLLVSATRQGVAVVSSAAHDTAAYISTNSLFWRKRRRRDFTSSNGDAVPLSKVFATSGGGGAGGGFGKKKGGGFGSTNAATKTASKTKKSPSNATTLTATNKKKKKKKSDLLTEVMETSTTATCKVAELSTENKEKINSPKLDRFGLPIPTQDDLFPPLPPDTEVVPVSYDATTGGTPLMKVKEALQNHLTLNLDALFDDHGIGLHDNADGKRMKLHLLHKSPPVLAIDNFFTSEECQECIDLATSADQQQTMRVNSATFSPYAQSKRTSTTWFCYYKQVPTLLAKARRLLGVPLEHMEEPQVVRYRTGEEFSWHYDEVPAVQLSNGGQRLATLLVYLNTLDTNRGGGTVFRDLKSCTDDQLTMKPTKGSALLFFPAYADGHPDDRTLHKGEVALDTKMIAQMWIHEGMYSPVVPDGNSHDDAREVIRAKELELGYQ